MHCLLPYVFFPFLRWVKFCSGCFRQVVFRLEDKKVITGRVRQVVVLYTNDYKTLTSKAYNKIRRATDIINRSSTERSILNAFRWSKLSNVTGCFTACIGAHFPAADLDNAIRFRLRSDPL